MNEKVPRPSDRPAPGSLSVREVLALDLLADARVLAGEDGLERRVQRMNVMSVPDVVRWTKEHELLLTTGYPLPKAPDALVQLLTGLDRRGVAAVGIKYGSYGPGLAPEALLAADKMGLPIIDIPEAVPFDDLLTQVLSRIVNRQAAVLARTQQIHEALLHIVLGGGGLDDIVRELSAALGGAGVICLDAAGLVLAQAADEAHWHRLRADDMLAAEGVVAVSRLRTSRHAVAAPVLAGTLRHGYLVVVPGTAALPAETEVMVQQSSIAAALEITKRLAVNSVERHFQSSALYELVTEGDRDASDLPPRAASSGWDLDRPLIVLIARPSPASADPPRNELRLQHDIDAWVNTVQRTDRHAVAGGLGRDLVAVCGADQGAEQTARVIGAHMRDTTRRAFSIGVSDIVSGANALPTGYRHARKALNIAEKTGRVGLILPYEALGLYRLLDSVTDQAQQAFVDEVLGTVLGRPAEEQAELLRTLDVLLAQHLNVAGSARTLGIHYNTLRYRISKLERLIGPFTEDSELSVQLSVAVEILRLRDNPTAAQA